MIIAVTGASGSIGKELTPFLESHGHSVLQISSSVPRNGKSIFSYQDLKEEAIHTSVDVFIHLASLNSNLDEDSIPLEVELTNNILKSLKSLGCKKLIFFSTGKVYAENSFSQQVFSESSELNPVCAYGKAKKLCEDLIHSKSKDLTFQSLILRLPPFLNQYDNSNLGKLIKFAKRGFLIPSFPQGNDNQRSFLSLGNAKAALESVLDNIDLAVNNQVYNLADDDCISLNNLLRTYSKKGIFVLPRSISNLFFKIPFLEGILLKLYGNFVLENLKLKNDMGVKLEPTSRLSNKIKK